MICGINVYLNITITYFIAVTITTTTDVFLKPKIIAQKNLNKRHSLNLDISHFYGT